jgi:hypothetical protein
MRALGASDVLALWERGARCHAIDRSVLLCAWARPDVPAAQIADLSLGTVTASLLHLREATFGGRILGHIDCPGCKSRLELDLSTVDLLQPNVDDPEPIDVRGWRVRAPSLRDLAAVANETDVERAARCLLQRCAPEYAGDAQILSDEALQEIEDAVDALDPNADLALTVHCEACGASVAAQLDAGALLWDEIDGRARALLFEVHALARAYGWTEGEILSLTAARRASYLAMADQ